MDGYNAHPQFYQNHFGHEQQQPANLNQNHHPYLQREKAVMGPFGENCGVYPPENIQAMHRVLDFLHNEYNVPRRGIFILHIDPELLSKMGVPQVSYRDMLEKMDLYPQSMYPSSSATPNQAGAFGYPYGYPASYLMNHDSQFHGQNTYTPAVVYPNTFPIPVTTPLDQFQNPAPEQHSKSVPLHPKFGDSTTAGYRYPQRPPKLNVPQQAESALSTQKVTQKAEESTPTMLSSQTTSESVKSEGLLPNIVNVKQPGKDSQMKNAEKDTFKEQNENVEVVVQPKMLSKRTLVRMSRRDRQKQRVADAEADYEDLFIKITYNFVEHLKLVEETHNQEQQVKRKPSKVNNVIREMNKTFGSYFDSDDENYVHPVIDIMQKVDFEPRESNKLSKNRKKKLQKEQRKMKRHQKDNLGAEFTKLIESSTEIEEIVENESTCSALNFQEEENTEQPISFEPEEKMTDENDQVTPLILKKLSKSQKKREKKREHRAALDHANISVALKENPDGSNNDALFSAKSDSVVDSAEIVEEGGTSEMSRMLQEREQKANLKKREKKQSMKMKKSAFAEVLTYVREFLPYDSLSPECQDFALKTMVYTNAVTESRQPLVAFRVRNARVPLYELDSTGLFQKINEHWARLPYKTWSDREMVTSYQDFLLSRIGFYISSKDSDPEIEKLCNLFKILTLTDNVYFFQDIEYIKVQLSSENSSERLELDYLKMFENIVDLQARNKLPIDCYVVDESKYSEEMERLIGKEHYRHFREYVTRQFNCRFWLKIDESIIGVERNMYEFAIERVSDGNGFTSETTNRFLARMRENAELLEDNEETRLFKRLYEFLLSIDSEIIDKDVYTLVRTFITSIEDCCRYHHRFMFSLWFGYE